MTTGEWVLLLGAGLLAGVINSVSSGGSFFTYPALRTFIIAFGLFVAAWQFLR